MNKFAKLKAVNNVLTKIATGSVWPQNPSPQQIHAFRIKAGVQNTGNPKLHDINDVSGLNRVQIQRKQDPYFYYLKRKGLLPKPRPVGFDFIAQKINDSMGYK